MKRKSMLINGIMTVVLSGMVICCSPAASSSGNDADNTSGKEAKELVIWSFTDEIQTIIDNYYKPDHSDVKIKYTLTPTDQFPNKLDPVLANGKGAPDVFALEDTFVRKYIEQGDALLLDLTDVYNEVKGKMIAYPAEIGTCNGKVYGLSWAVSPGAMFYRRSLAMKYFGTDDSKEIQKKVANWDAFNAAASELKTKSNGKCVIVSTTGDLFKPFQGARKDPWVVNGKLVVDPAMEAYMDTCKFFKENGYEGRQSLWAEGWFAGMKGELKDGTGAEVEVFSYFLPTWGLHYVLKTNAPNTAGDWYMCQGPSAYRWGGTWVAAYKKTKVPNLAKNFIKYVTLDDSFLERWAKDTGDIVSNSNVINKIKDTYSQPYLNGQNNYARFAEIAYNVDGTLDQSTDLKIEAIWNECVRAYVNGEKTKDNALSAFKQNVKSQLGIDY